MSPRTLQERLVPLDSAQDLQVAGDSRDVRGWDVVAADGRKIGEVEHLLVDTDAMRVRYLDLSLDRGLFRFDKRVLIPIGNTRLDESRRQVLLEGLASTELQDLPAYEGSITEEYESSVQSFFERWSGARSAGTASRAYSDTEPYRTDRGRTEETRVTLSEEELAVGKRREQGEVVVGKRVETERVQQSVPVRHEEVTVERRPVTAGSDTQPNITEDEVRIPLLKEEVVAQKRVVPKEELVIKKQVVEETETVEADVRRERAEVRGEGVDPLEPGRPRRRS